MDEPANFQPDDPAKLENMNCSDEYNRPPYMPRELQVVSIYNYSYYLVLKLLSNYPNFYLAEIRFLVIASINLIVYHL